MLQPPHRERCDSADMEEVIFRICRDYDKDRLQRFLSETRQNLPLVLASDSRLCKASSHSTPPGTRSVSSCTSREVELRRQVSVAEPGASGNNNQHEEHDNMVRNNDRDNRAGHDEVTKDSGVSCERLSSDVDSELDFDTLKKNQEELVAGCFYFPSLDQATAMELLRKAEVGSFLVRDSSHPDYIYTVSVKSEQGATSVRISYIDGLFGFDGDEEQPKVHTCFGSLMTLLDFHALNLRKYGKRLTMRAKTCRKAVEIPFIKPFRRTVPSLAHLARVKINSSLDTGEFYELSVASLPLSSKHKQFLRDYPYRL
ncbi:suppressor of cytokine signaling 2 [Aplysia californica]|uniref:Suppressor of cytokine signaling 2 n=1 Tax=Aplysia californica TaxID=6500 RepID=A0ABM0K3V4_APLCA|nr:suppressor of cytokine signaling 2 [Aplysia californica]XP_005108141.1 suppressor of cytokine signaling 2 [Aplysia californica]